MKLDPFYLIVDSAGWIERLGPAGLRLVQLRIKQGTQEALRAEIRAARAAAQKHGCQLVINDHWQLAIEEDCDFVHLGQEDLADADLAAIRSAGLRLGVSTHDESELAAALAVEPDYVALGPIYPTTLKRMDWQPQGLSRIGEWRQKSGETPLVAIGGLTCERVAKVLQAGADAAAVSTDVLGAADPLARARAWIAATAPWR
ncbi:thiamine phosphate synthase [Stappia sp. F7233]|uniref:Thiamine-phosphate synthase n=1 Tax=Stappia albiluteola TaxID=2758565 RepID=A0A839A912_9HYPH|nr:thiamine phosphate synthase [Stappia albiluteola]MBA5776023.1 thiamine phosphate synthase [Stappia albiluteola]